MERFGLADDVIDRICAVIADFPEIERAVIYGSRAKGNYRAGSDIDLTLFGDALTEEQLLRLETRLDDLMLPYTFDLSRFAAIENRDLAGHIERVGRLFYAKSGR